MRMEINALGALAAFTAFLSIWIGHVSVRKIEASTVRLWKPVVLAILLGLGLEAAALLTAKRPLSAVFGILGTTLLWDVLELRRQAKRVRKGHAPANPANPRHAALLAEPGSHATTRDLLKRDPLGRPVEAGEALALAGADRQEAG